MESADEAVIVFPYRVEQVKHGTRDRIDNRRVFAKPACGWGKLTLARIASELSPPRIPSEVLNSTSLEL